MGGKTGLSGATAVQSSPTRVDVSHSSPIRVAASEMGDVASVHSSSIGESGAVFLEDDISMVKSVEFVYNGTWKVS
jgi:hypothetical protein